jgi:hypothetical protein
MTAAVKDLQSFTSLSTIHLPGPHILHPNACNPAMDLVTLISDSAGSGPAGALGVTTSKGKGKAFDISPGGCNVSLWRLSGSKVWETHVAGTIAGLAWSIDGQFCLK